MSIKKKDFEKLLKERFPEASFNVVDTRGDEDHYRVEISSPLFDEMTRLERHRVVNGKLKDYLTDKIHSVEFVITTGVKH